MSRKIKNDEATQFVAKSEILQVADMVAKEKGLGKDDILDAMEQAILKTAQIKYGETSKLEAHIDRKTGEIELYRLLTIVDGKPKSNDEISISDAKKQSFDARVGGVLRDKLPPFNRERVAAGIARGVISQKVQLAERKKQYDEFSTKVGDIITGTVKRVEYNNVILDVGRTEGVLRKYDAIPHENFKIGERIKVYLVGLNKEQNAPLLMLSRTSSDFMKKLFEQEVPEIYDGIVEIKSVARDPGSKAKIAVFSKDSSLDPVGACVGIKGARVQAVVDELKGEKIDVVKWSDNIAVFVVNSLSPADVKKVIIEENTGRVTAVVQDDMFSVAIGRRGQNVKLASKLTQCNINVVTNSEDVQRRQEENSMKIAYFRQILDIDEMIAMLLVNEGFRYIQDVAEEAIDVLVSINGFDENIAKELQNRAQEYMDKVKDKIKNTSEIDEVLLNGEIIPLEILAILTDNGIKTLSEIGDLSSDVLQEMTENKLTKSETDMLIIQVREYLKEE